MTTEELTCQMCGKVFDTRYNLARGSMHLDTCPRKKQYVAAVMAMQTSSTESCKQDEGARYYTID